MATVTRVPVAGDVRVTGRRVVATWIDLMLFALIYQPLASPLRLSLGMDVQSGDSPGSSHGDYSSRVANSFPALLVYLLVVGIYYVVLESLGGRTVGKWLTGIRVVTDTGAKAGVGRVLVRTVMRLLDGIFGYLVGFVVVVSSPSRRRLGDIIAGTQVVRASRFRDRVITTLLP